MARGTLSRDPTITPHPRWRRVYTVNRVAITETRMHGPKHMIQYDKDGQPHIVECNQFPLRQVVGYDDRQPTSDIKAEPMVIMGKAYALVWDAIYHEFDMKHWPSGIAEAQGSVELMAEVVGAKNYTWKNHDGQTVKRYRCYTHKDGPNYSYNDGAWRHKSTWERMKADEFAFEELSMISRTNRSVSTLIPAADVFRMLTTGDMDYIDAPRYRDPQQWWRRSEVRYLLWCNYTNFSAYCNHLLDAIGIGMYRGPAGLAKALTKDNRAIKLLELMANTKQQVA